MVGASSSDSRIFASFCTAAVVVVVLAASTWRVARDATESARWVSHTHEVLNSLAQAKAATVQIELSTQSFRISGDTKHLAERDRVIAEREATLQQIKELTADNPRQQERWTDLRQVINERLAISRQSEWLRKTQGVEAATEFVAKAPLQETRQRTYGLLNEMHADELKLLEMRSAEQASSRRVLPATAIGVALSLVVLLSIAYVGIRRQLRETEAHRRALALSEESLSTTLHSIGDGVLACDTEGRVTRMNPVAESLTGWTFAEAKGRHVEEVFRIVNERTRAPASNPIDAVLATGKTQALMNHTALIARSGSETPIADSAAPIRDPAGKLTGVVLVFRDVTTERVAEDTVRKQNELLEGRVQERTQQLLESQEHLRSVISNVPALIAYVDNQQRYVYVNRQYRERFAADKEDITGYTVREILGEERYAIAGPLIAKVLNGEPQSYDWQPFPNVWHVINYVPKRDPDGAVAGYYVLGTDITERKKAEEHIKVLNTELEQHVHDLEHVTRALRMLSAGNRAMLRAKEEQDLLDSMCEAIVTCGSYPMAAVWYGDPVERASLRPMAQCGCANGLEGLRDLAASWLGGRGIENFAFTALRTGESVVVPETSADPACAAWSVADGHASGVACPLRVGNQVIGVLTICGAEKNGFDSSEISLLNESADDLAFGIANLRAAATQKETEAAMQRMSRFDALTGLPNEASFAERFRAALDDASRNRSPVSVLQANVERLSEINDALGFDHGNHLLKEFGSRLKAAVPESCTIARLRGDEFGILAPRTDTAEAAALAQRIEASLSKPFPIADIDLDISAKFGIATFPQHGSTPHDLFRHVDIAAHQAKKRRAKWVVFQPGGSRDQRRRLLIVSELRRAIDNGDLALYLQPKIDFATLRVCGAEGLVRWVHRERGIVSPAEFIELAEQTGLIKPLTESVIEMALRQIRGFERAGNPLPIAVNLSAQNLRDESLLVTIRDMTRSYGINPSLLEVEITENAVMDDAEYALEVLNRLREEGVQIYIDDFGTGYSSLSYLQRLPVDYIKIDQSFVRDMSLQPDSAVIVRSTIDLAHDLGCRTVAEGIESRNDWDLLARMGCDVAQGYFIARPMPASDFCNWVAGYSPLAFQGGDEQA
ncbi:EAL domain-containing protein [Propionivibrio soli]|uniref:EAL domain-containing protein n=1 Tax=Propionivibrio soli TaxID=2976531 RepID=UPI0021E851D4